MKPQINFVSALSNEAAPLIKYYDLKLINHYPFKVFKNKNFWLIISGVGINLVKQACIHLSKLTNCHQYIVWLNIGTAGHFSYNIGDIFLAHKVIDEKSSKTYYPPQILNVKLPSTVIKTIINPLSKYEEDKIFDMEASGFFEICSKLSILEFVQSVKIISDNKDSPNFNNKKIESLIANSLNIVNELVDELYVLSKKQCSLVLPNELLEKFLNNWHFTFTQTHQLKKILNKLRLLRPDIDLFNQVILCKQSKEVIKLLESKIYNHDKNNIY